jgi:hypothetical protein
MKDKDDMSERVDEKVKRQRKEIYDLLLSQQEENNNREESTVDHPTIMRRSINQSSCLIKQTEVLFYY